MLRDLMPSSTASWNSAQRTDQVLWQCWASTVLEGPAGRYHLGTRSLKRSPEADGSWEWSYLSPFLASSLIWCAIGSSGHDACTEQVFCAIHCAASFSCMTSSKSLSLFVHRLYNREKSSSVPSKAIVMMNMLLIVMNSHTGTVGAI